jgi:hypothetical protein
VISHSLRNGPEARDTLINMIKTREEMLDRPDRYAAQPSQWRTLALDHSPLNP